MLKLSENKKSEWDDRKCTEMDESLLNWSPLKLQDFISFPAHEAAISPALNWTGGENITKGSFVGGDVDRERSLRNYHHSVDCGR